MIRILIKIIAALMASVAVAQPVFQGLTPEEIVQLRQRLQGAGQAVQAPSPVDVVRFGAGQVSQPRALPLATQGQEGEDLRRSAVEEDYGNRVGEALRQFGYEAFRRHVPADATFMGAVGDDYVLGVGEELVVTFLGETTNTVNTRIDREGRVVLPGLAPIMAAGRPLGEFRDELVERVKSAFIGTRVYVSVGAVRLIRVVVAGEVREPGAHQLTGLSTLLDALYQAGGIKKSGTLRNVRLRRQGDQKTVDLYDLLVDGALDPGLTLREGDQVFVPTLGPTVAVAGDVTRPGIYELQSFGARPTAARILEWAGGATRPSGNRVLHFSLDAEGRDRIVEHLDLAGLRPHNGDIIKVQGSSERFAGSVLLDGHVRSPGLRSLGAARTLSGLLGGVDDLREDPYLPFGVLMRLDEQTRVRELRGINLGAFLSGTADLELRSDDVVVVLSKEAVRFLRTPAVQATLLGLAAKPSRVGPLEGEEVGLVEDVAADAPAVGASAGSCRGVDRLRGLLATEGSSRFAFALQGLVTETSVLDLPLMACPEVYDRYPSLLPFVLEHVVGVYGEVREPGAFPVTEGTPLTELLPYAGGLTREADRTSLELAQMAFAPQEGTAVLQRSRVNLLQQAPERVVLSPGDALRVNPVFTDRETGPVRLTGEFVRPGFYQITRGERLSSVIARAGGLTEQAYPYGAVFTRERVKEEERQTFERYARELQAAMVTAVTTSRGRVGTQTAADAIGGLIQMARETEPVGRMVVEADPLVLQVRPEKDILLEPGDRLHLPKRPSSVTVIGEVLNPGTIAFESGSSADDYIASAGGVGQAADEGRIFVVYPNGSAQPLAVSAWNYQSTLLPPGSTIVVPRDPLPFDFLTFSTSIAGILSDLAVAASALNTIND